MTKAQRVQQAAIKEAAMQDAAVLAYEAELRRIFNLLTKRLKVVLGKWQTDAAGRMLTSRQNLVRVFALRRDVREALRAAGFDKAALAAVDDPLDALASRVLSHAGIANKAVRLTPLSLDAIAAFKELRLADLLDLAEDVARTVQRAALDGVLGVRPVDRLVRDVAEALDLSVRQARTIYDTAVSTFTRQIEQMTATGQDGELFFYVGPVDAKTRPFCLKHVGKVYTRDEIDALDNGQIGDVFISGGGYNCRHVFKRVSVLDEELIELRESGKRASWIADALKRVA
jgi:histone H3/H4